jgi:hypothetical protein
MQSCLWFSRSGKPLLCISARPWYACSGGIVRLVPMVSSVNANLAGQFNLPNLSLSNGRTLHIAQSVSRKLHKKTFQTISPQDTRSDGKSQIFTGHPPQTVPVPRDDDPLWTAGSSLKPEEQSRLGRNPCSTPLSARSSITTDLRDSAFSRRFLLSAERKGANIEARKEQDWSPGVVLAKFLAMTDESEKEKLWTYARKRYSHRSLPIITIFHLLRSSLPMVRYFSRFL